MEYRVGKWNDHKIIIEERATRDILFIDGKQIEEANTFNLSGSTAFFTEVPFYEELSYNIFKNGSGHAVCSCIVGKPLEVQFVEEKKLYIAQYNGLVIETEFDSNAPLYVNGKELPFSKTKCEKFAVKCGEKDENGKSIIVVCEKITDHKPVCRIYAEAEHIEMIYCSKNGEEFVPIHEDDDDAAAAAMLATIISTM